ncbi:ATP-binding protein [Pseudonocardia hispaniensis]|uniref:histidine kinase n=1 Tax=Pseudonocardia hispaniensis TaxID=904933 RepID=A0ABW1IWF4_9PSEU
MIRKLLEYLPRGNTLDAKAWQRRHRLLQWILLAHVPVIAVLGLSLGWSVMAVGAALIAPIAGLVLGHLIRHRRLASFFITGGFVSCSLALVLLTRGTIEAHFHFFIIIGFIALYQDWVPFLWNAVFTTVSHGIGVIGFGALIFNHPAAQANPWLWSFIHGIAVLIACAGVVIFWKITEDEQSEKEELGRQLITADAEIGRRRFASDLLVNLARRNQSMLHKQLDIINQLEEKEQDPDALAELFRLDHLATRVRRNAENLLVLAGEQPPRTWSAPVPLRDVVRAAIAETEDLDRVVFVVDDQAAVAGHTVADLTHLLAELTENAVRFSPPETSVTIRTRPNPRDEGGQLLTVEDWGVGMPEDEMAAANAMLASPPEVDLSVSQRLGFHVVARLAVRHGIEVSLSATPGTGVTAVVVLPSALFTSALAAGATQSLRAGPVPAPAAPTLNRGAHASVPGPYPRPEPTYVTSGAAAATTTAVQPGRDETWVPPRPPAPATMLPSFGESDGWTGWWDPSDRTAAGGSNARPDAAGTSSPAVTSAPPEAARTPAAEASAPSVAAPTPSAESSARHPAPTPRSPIPQPRTVEALSPRPSVSVPSPGGLRRRVPQSHLAPELRQPEPEAATVTAPSPEAARALSRYQASRQAAQAVVEGEPEGQPGRGEVDQ